LLPCFSRFQSSTISPPVSAASRAFSGSCALFISLCTLFAAPILYFQSLAYSLTKTAGVVPLVLLTFTLLCSPQAIISQTPAPAQRGLGSIEGQLRTSKGEPQAGASVILEDKQHATLAEAHSNKDGTFAFPALRPGAYTLRAEKGALRSAIVASVSLSRGERKRVDLILDVTESSASPVQFSEKPNFTVAGVTDASTMGGHGSEVKVRTSEALANETARLKSGGPERTSAPGPASRETEKKLRATLPSVPGNSEKGQIYRRLGDLDEQLGDPLAAVRDYESAVRLDPSEQNYFNWGTELLLHKAATPAIEVFTKGAEVHANSSRMLAGLGAALYSNGSYAEAARRLCDASDLNPTDAAPYDFLGEMAKASPDLLPCAEAKLARFAKEQPGNALANYYYALALGKRANVSEDPAALTQVEALLEKTVSIDSKLDEAYVRLGSVYTARGEFAQAMSSYKKAIAVNPQSGEAHYRLSLAYKRAGEDAKAQQEMQLYIQIEKTEAAAVERQRRELRQFMIILKDQQSPATPR
jgi:tetratricopeptide (TPR) repeat protein